jgi:hypothetical protein
VALLFQHKITPVGTWATAVDRLVWALGHATEEIIVEWASEAGLVLGDWRCVHCGWAVAFSKRPSACVECGTKAEFRYEEVRVVSSVSGIGCGIDMLVRLPHKSLLTVVEIKSLKQDQFQSLKTAFGEHRLRTNLYMRCIEESDLPWRGMIDTTKGIVLYVCKQGWGVKDTKIPAMGFGEKPFTAFKEFEIERDDSLTQYLVDLAEPLENWKKEVKRTKDLHRVPPAGICPNMLCPRAQTCEVREQCF